MLGKYELNKIYNEDCYEAIKNIPDKSIDLVYTDPPYLYQSGFGDRLQQIGKRNNIKNLSDGINIELLKQLCRVMKNIYIYMVQR